MTVSGSRRARQTFTPTATKSGDSVSGDLTAAYSPLPWLDCEAVFGTGGSMSANLVAADNLMKGLTLTAECEGPGKNGPLSVANCIAEYKAEAFACKTSMDYFKKDLLGAPAAHGGRTRDAARMGATREPRSAH